MTPVWHKRHKFLKHYIAIVASAEVLLLILNKGHL